MGSKHSKSKKNKDKYKTNNTENKQNNIIDDELDFDGNFNNSNIDNKQQKCPNCHKIFPLNTPIQKNTWSFHQKSCKPRYNSYTSNIINPPHL